MQGYIRVSAAGSQVALSANTSPRAATQAARRTAALNPAAQEHLQHGKGGR